MDMKQIMVAALMGSISAEWGVKCEVYKVYLSSSVEEETFYSSGFGQSLDDLNNKCKDYCENLNVEIGNTKQSCCHAIELLRERGSTSWPLFPMVKCRYRAWD